MTDTIKDFMYQCECNLSYVSNSDKVTVEIGQQHLIDIHQAALQAAYAEGLEAAAESIKEPIGQIVYDGWYKREWPVTSHGYQKVREACCEAIRALPNKYEVK